LVAEEDTIRAVSTLPTILVAGGGGFYVKLIDAFPPTICNLVYSDTAAEVLNRAASAAAVVVDVNLPGGGLDLCRRLRSDPVTSHIPLILRVNQPGDHVQAITDARVLASDLQGLVKAVRRLCPDLASPGAAAPAIPHAEEDPAVFDDRVKTILFRRPPTAPGTALGWPPPPPTLQPYGDLLDFSQTFAGYLNSLIEAHDLPANLSESEGQRLREMADRALTEADRHVASLQSAVMEALVAKDLDRMKLLSSAKNSLYDKQQRLRAVRASLEGARFSQADESPEVAAVSTSPASRPAPTATPPEPVQTVPQKKSELTRAAEAKKAERVQHQQLKKSEAVDRAQQARPPRVLRPQLPTSAQPLPSSDHRATWVVVTLGLALAAVALTFYFRRPRTDTTPAQGTNRAPTMKLVALDQTPAGIIVRAKAEDPEGDPVSFTIRWRVNGAPVEGERTARLATNVFRSGDTIQVEVQPTDGMNTGSPMVSTPLVAADLPSPEDTRRRAVPPASPPSPGDVPPLPAPDPGSMEPSPAPAPGGVEPPSAAASPPPAPPGAPPASSAPSPAAPPTDGGR
jgi:CheY-like chemotaxis protein